ncbi:MAG: hypothetical protein WC663_04835 [Patescibacteria group bacterium]|jgi:hypothetical protein
MERSVETSQFADIKEPGEVKETPGFEFEKTEYSEQFVTEANEIAKAIERDKPVLLDQVLKLREALEKMVESDPKVEAKRLFGEGYMGPDEIEAHFTVQDENGNVEKLFEYTPEEKEKINQMLREKLDDPQIKDLIRRTPKEELREKFQLFLFPDKFKDGMPVTMKSLNERFQPEMTRRGLGKLFVGDVTESWYAKVEEPFFISDSAKKLEWKLVSRGNIEGSYNHDAFDETRILREFLTVNNLATTEELAEAWNGKLDALRQLQLTDVKDAARQLSELKINQNYRMDPLQVIFLHAMQKSFLGNNYTRTAKLSSDGRLVDVGRCSAGGAGVRTAFLVNFSGILGVSFSI